MRTATSDDVPSARSVLARAYAADPLMAWVFPEAPTRLQAIAAWLGLFVEPAVVAGAVDVLDAEEGGLAAVAAWRLPADPPASPSGLPTVAGLLAALVGPEHAAVVGAGLAALRPLAPQGPSAYVQFLAVDPDQQRRGLGRAALAPGLARAAAAGLGVHLETADPGALSFYAALGFTIDGTVDLPGSGPRLWALSR